jgi:hypothetical protein
VWDFFDSDIRTTDAVVKKQYLHYGWNEANSKEVDWWSSFVIAIGDKGCQGNCAISREESKSCIDTVQEQLL